MASNGGTQSARYNEFKEGIHHVKHRSMYHGWSGRCRDLNILTFSYLKSTRTALLEYCNSVFVK